MTSTSKNAEKNLEARRRYYAANAEKERARVRRYRASHLETEREADRSYRAANLERRREWDRLYCKANPAKQREAKRRWRAANLEHAREVVRLWYAKNRECVGEYRRTRRSVVPQYRLAERLRARLRHALRSQSAVKSARTEELLGCSIQMARTWIEAQFCPGMTWGNIHIDHIRPCASFDLTDSEQQRRCFHWANLQPLFALDNQMKAAKL